MKNKIISYFFMSILVITVSLALPLSVRAETSGSCGDNIRWVLEDGTLTLNGTGTMYDYNNHSNTSRFYKNSNITNIIIGEGITNIGEAMFYYLPNLETISFPSTITSIGDRAFSLAGKITELKIPSNTKTIGASAFHSCELLNDVSLPDGLKSIGDDVFSECDAIRKITISATVKSIGQQDHIILHNNSSQHKRPLPDMTKVLQIILFQNADNPSGYANLRPKTSRTS